MLTYESYCLKDAYSLYLCPYCFIKCFYFDTDSSNGYTSRFLGFSVHVSNSTSISDGTLCFKDKYFTKRTIPEVFNTTCHIYGQYVIFYNERLPGVVYPKDYSTFAHSDICEFEVYGKCRPSSNDQPQWNVVWFLHRPESHMRPIVVGLRSFWCVVT